MSEDAELSPESRKTLARLLKRWRELEGRLKASEQVTHLANVPAVNELRYAGRLLVASLSNTSLDPEIKSIDDALVVAEQYITNAEHDLLDGLVYFYSERLDALKSRVGGAKLREFPLVSRLTEKVDEAQSLIQKSRANLSERKENYKKVGALIIPEIEKDYAALIDGEILINYELGVFQRTVFRQRVLATITSLVAIVALVLYFTK